MKRSRPRQIAMVALVILTGVSMLATTLAVWVDRTLLNTDAWVATIGPLAADPDVQVAVATELTTQIFEAVDVETRVAELLPDRASVLAAPITTTVQGYVTEGVEAILASEQFQTVWIEVNRRAHETAIKVLRGESIAGVSAQDGQVSINLLPLMSRVLSFVDEKIPDLLTDGRPVPDITADTPQDEARAELSEALGRDLPDGFGVIDLYDSQQLAAAQQIVEMLDRLAVALPVMSLLLAVATVVVAEHRRRALILLGLSVAGLVALAFGLTRAVRNQILELVATPESRRAVAAAISTVVHDLRTICLLLIVTGVIVAIAGFLSGDSRPARAIRHAFDGAGDRVPQVRDRIDMIRSGVAIAAAGVLVVWLLAGNPTWGALLVAILVFALLETAMALLRP